MYEYLKKNRKFSNFESKKKIVKIIVIFHF